jgi:hypothetical protein
MGKIVNLGLSMVVASLLLTGCGGGGGSSGGTDTPSTQSLSGNVADGYLVGAKVCLDKNGNSKCDSDEPSATTGAKGKYTLSNLTANDINTYPLLVEVDELVVDEDDNQTVAQFYTLKATPGQTFISPISTMIRNYETTNNVTHTVARAAIENLLGIDNVALSVDNYIENNSTEATEVHKKAKIIANMKMQVFQRLGTTAQNYDAKVVDKYIDNIVMGKLGTVKTEVESNVLDLQTNIANVMALVNTSNFTTNLNTIKTQYETEAIVELTKSLGTTINDLTSSTTIQQNTKYKKTYLGGTDLKNFTIKDSQNKSCTLYTLDTTNVFNQYSSYAYMINGSDYESTKYTLSKNTTGNVKFSLAWMYYTMENSHVDFFVNCK